MTFQKGHKGINKGDKIAEQKEPAVNAPAVNAPATPNDIKTLMLELKNSVADIAENVSNLTDRVKRLENPELIELTQKGLTPAPHNPKIPPEVRSEIDKTLGVDIIADTEEVTGFGYRLHLTMPDRLKNHKVDKDIRSSTPITPAGGINEVVLFLAKVKANLVKRMTRDGVTPTF